MKRRDFVKGLGMASLAGAVAACTKNGGNAASDDDGHSVDYLFVQNANSATLENGVLTLEGVNSQTIYFSDRPDRIVGHGSTEEFVANWGHGGDDSFAAVPPNAALSLLGEEESHDVVVVLKSPRLDGNTLVYDVDVLDGPEAISGKGAALFIDVIGRPLTPLSVAGGRRRVRRRTRRRVERRN